MRTDLAEKLEIVGEVFEDEKMVELLSKIKTGMSNASLTAVLYQMESRLMKSNENLCDRLIDAAEFEKKAAEMEDKEYQKALQEVLLKDVLGFFG